MELYLRQFSTNSVQTWLLDQLQGILLSRVDVYSLTGPSQKLKKKRRKVYSFTHHALLAKNSQHHDGKERKVEIFAGCVCYAGICCSASIRKRLHVLENLKK